MADDLPAKEDETPEGLPVRWEPMNPEPDFNVHTSLPVKTVEDRLAVLRILESDALKGQELTNQSIQLSDYIAHSVQIIDPETSELTDAVRIILLGPDQPPISFVSIGILKSLQRLVKAVGHAPPFDPPLQLVIKQQSTRGARRTFKLIPKE